MPFELLAQYLKLPVFALVAARLGGLIMFQPVLGSLAVPTNVRVGLVLGLAALLTPVVSLPATAPATPGGIVLAMAGEVLLGALIGAVSVACFIGLQMGGLLIAQESGIAFGQIVDPNTEEQETVIGMFYLQLAMVVFLIVGGHRAIVAACLETFRTIPLLDGGFSARLGSDLLLQALTLGGQVALRVAAPTMLAMFLVNLAMGFISRTMPQFNILSFGFSVKSMLAFLLMAVSLPSAANALVGALEHACRWLNTLIGT
jgi:flagellar biosynthetic protein FliR